MQLSSKRPQIEYEMSRHVVDEGTRRQQNRSPGAVVCAEGDKTDRILPMVQQVPSTLPHTDLP